MTLQRLLDAYNTPNVAAFLRVIRNSESSQDDSAYTVLWGGDHFESFADHPRKHFPLPGGQTTSAAGAYQITETTWNGLVRQFAFTDFSPPNQDLAAIALIAGRGALDDVTAGRLYAAIRRLTQEWTSLAIAKRQEEAGAVFAQYGGTLAEETQAPKSLMANPIATPQVKPMGVFAALLPSIIQLIPALGSLFGSGSEVQQRNVAAAKVVGDALVTATNAVNVQDAVDKMQSDKDALQAATDAIHELLPQLMDVGGGIESARKFAADHENNRYGRILEVVTYSALLFLLLANAETFAAAVLKDDYSQIAAVIQADIGVGLMAFGFFLGSSLSSKRKDERQGVQ